jgi:glycosyltransferase involved in cell wall biosynthesis
MIPTYNCAEFVVKSITSVLEQDMGADFMQIEVIDDCSTDNIVEVVKNIAGSRVEFFKQERNVGHVKNFETALNRAKGKIIHLLHGDDFVLPGFYKAMLEMYQANPDIGACYCRHFFVDEKNNIIQISELREKNNAVISNFYKTLIHGQKIQTPSITVKKEVYEKLGTFNPTLTWTEDWEMWVRISSKYPIGYIKEPLAAYRIHKNSSTSSKSITGENVKDIQRLKKIFINYVDNINELDELENSFKKYIFNISASNYQSSKLIKDREAYKHLLSMANNSISLRRKVLIYLKFLAKRKWI